MVKLLRLVSPQPNPQQGTMQSTFQAYLNDGMVLPVNSKVALRSLVLPLTSYITIDDTSKTFTILPKKSGAAFDVVLSVGKYSIDTLTREINNQICNNLRITSISSIGILIVYATEFTGGKLLSTFQYTRVKEKAFDSPLIENISLNNNVYSVLATTPDPDVANYECWSLSREYLLKGASYVRTTLSQVGLMNLFITSLYDDSADIAESLQEYFLKIRSDNGFKYSYYNKDTSAVVNTAIAALQNDVISLEMSNRKIQYKVYDAAGNVKLEFIHDKTFVDLTTNFRTGVVLLDKVVGTSVPVLLRDPRFSLDADLNIVMSTTFSNIVEYNNEIMENNLGVMPVAGATAGILTIDFKKGLKLSELLGFSEPQLISQNTSTFIFTSDEGIDAVMSGKSAIVEIPSISLLEAYDTSLNINKRRPIIDVIPINLSYQNSKVVYQPSSLLYLSIGNSTEILLRNILVNIYIDVDNGEEFGICDDQIEMVLVFD